MKRIRRYQLAAFALLTGLASGLCAENQLDWRFNVLLDGKEIGEHTYRLNFDQGIVKVETEASFEVKFLFFTAYRYLHKNTEVWDGNGLLKIDAYTDANGDVSSVEGSRKEGVFRLNVNGEVSELPPDLWSFAYWNPRIEGQSRLLNAQTGEYEEVQVSVDNDADPIEYGGRSIPARRVDLMVKGLPVSVWYATSDNRWLALESETKSGRMLTYVPQALPPDASPAIATFNQSQSYETTSPSIP